MLLIYRLDRAWHGVQTYRSRRSGSKMGHPKEPPRHELRQTKPLSSLLLRERNHAEGSGRTLCVQIRLQSRGPIQYGLSRLTETVHQTGVSRTQTREPTCISAASSHAQGALPQTTIPTTTFCQSHIQLLSSRVGPGHHLRLLAAQT